MQIYKQYNQQELNLQYNTRIDVPDFETYLERWKTLSRVAENELYFIKDIPYGNLHRECLDVFPSGVAGSKTLLFIHGGYWQRFDKSLFYFIAGTFAKYGVTTVLMNYPLAPDATMDIIVDSCKKARHWLSDHLTRLNGDPNQIFIAGHSAGAHLAAMLLVMEKKEINRHAIKGVCLMSGLFNLLPVQLSYINDVVQMNKAMALTNSPAFLIPLQSVNLLLAVGEAETAEFKDQSNELYSNWKNKISSIEVLHLAGLHHFSIIDSIHDSNSLLHTSMRKLMDI